MARTILIKAVIEGSGIVNFDSNDQKYLWNQQKTVERCFHNNVSFGKGRYYKDGEDIVKVPIISADCIRHHMYEDNMAIQLPNIMHNDELLLNTVATPALIVRGYLFARDNKSIWKRKSPFSLSYAKGIKHSESALETFSNTQPKNGIEKDENAAETSFFKKEVRGDTTYEVTGAIDLRELAFISVSDVHDRLSFDSDYQEKFREKFAKRIGSKVSEASYYLKKNDIYEVPELGILLTQEQTKLLALDVLKRLACLNIMRTVNGFAKTISVKVKFIDDPLTDMQSDNWIDVFVDGKFNSNLFDNIEFDSGYTQVDIKELASEKVQGYKKKYGAEKAKPKRGSKKTNSESKAAEFSGDIDIPEIPS